MASWIEIVQNEVELLQSAKVIDEWHYVPLPKSEARSGSDCFVCTSATGENMVFKQFQDRKDQTILSSSRKLFAEELLESVLHKIAKRTKTIPIRQTDRRHDKKADYRERAHY